MAGLAFAPGTLTVARGTAAVFDNDDTAPHTVTARSGGVDSGVLDPGKQFSATVTCLAGPAGPTSPTRVLLHSVFGSLVFGLLAAKYTALKLRPSWGRYLPWIGSGLFLTFAAIWATSVADYVTAR